MCTLKLFNLILIARITLQKQLVNKHRWLSRKLGQRRSRIANIKPIALLVWIYMYQSPLQIFLDYFWA